MNMPSDYEILRDISRENNTMETFDYFINTFNHQGLIRKFTSKYCKYLGQNKIPFLFINPLESNQGNGLCFTLNGNFFLKNYAIYGIGEEDLMSFLPDNINCRILNPKNISNRVLWYSGFFKAMDDVDKFARNIIRRVENFLKSNTIRDICQIKFKNNFIIRIIYLEDDSYDVEVNFEPNKEDNFEKIGEPFRSIIGERYNPCREKNDHEDEEEDQAIAY